MQRTLLQYWHSSVHITRALATAAWWLNEGRSATEAAAAAAAVVVVAAAVVAVLAGLCVGTRKPRCLK